MHGSKPKKGRRAAEPWYQKRKRELEAAIATKRKHATDPFARVSLAWATAAAKATKTPKALVWTRLLYLSWWNQIQPFKLPNRWFAARGVNRFAKNRALNELEAAGLIAVERREGKSPRVTVLKKKKVGTRAH
jgi:hypothetical protein